jgi:transposase InsO family protein
MKNLNKYQKANKTQKKEMLDMLVEQTGVHRKSLIRKLNRGLNNRKRGGSKPKYPEKTRDMLKMAWESRDYICAELLHPILNEVITELVKHGYCNEFSEDEIKMIANMPLGTLKYNFKKIRLEMRKIPNYWRRSKNNLKKTIPVCTVMNKSTHAGCIEIDFVDHNGGNASGQYARTLCAVDVYTQMVSRRVTRGRIEERVQDATAKALNKMPFSLRKLHSDNESALLNSLIFQQARRMGLVISRSRSYQKQDNGHVEQKNGNKIRGLVGYRRYDTDEEMELLNRIYALDDVFQNHFIPSMRLAKKIYNDDGKLIEKIYDAAKTPYQRVLEDKMVPREVKKELKLVHEELNPLELKEERNKLITKLKSFG